jgi:hypothetical protein
MPDPGYGRWVKEEYGEMADQRFALDEKLGELLSVGWRPRALANIFLKRELSEALPLAADLVEETARRLAAGGPIPGGAAPCVFR